MSILTSTSYHHAVSRVSRWCSWYTREVDVEVAAIRRDELASDLYEHAIWADESGTTPRVAAREILGRALRGAPADLTWRHAQRRKVALADPTHFRRLRIEGAISSLVLIAASAVLGWGLFVLTRIGLSTIGEQIRFGSATAVTIASFTALAACGLVLLLRRRTRVGGALVMVLPSFGLVHFGLFQLYSLSATVGALTFTMPGWELASNSLIVGLGLFFTAAAIWWWPERRNAPADTSTRLKTIGEMTR